MTVSVYGDGKLLVKTPPMNFGDKAREITANIAGRHVIELISRSTTGANEQPVIVTWGAARLKE